MPTEIYTCKEAAKYLGVALNTLYAAVQEKRLRPDGTVSFRYGERKDLGTRTGHFFVQKTLDEYAKADPWISTGTRPGAPPHSAEWRSEALFMWQTGCTIPKIALDLGLTERTIRDGIRKAKEELSGQANRK